jgi:hypothetical protein
MKKKHKIITISLFANNQVELQARLCELLDEGWKLERVDSPHTGSINQTLVYLLSKEE